jgi:hypothetical protein
MPGDTRRTWRLTGANGPMSAHDTHNLLSELVTVPGGSEEASRKGNANSHFPTTRRISDSDVDGDGI